MPRKRRRLLRDTDAPAPGAKPADEKPPPPCPVPADAGDSDAWFKLGKKLGLGDEKRCALHAYLAQAERFTGRICGARGECSVASSIRAGS